jgi:hypothetical protein
MTGELKEKFSALTEEQQAQVLAAYAHELTVLAREGYEVGTERLSDPLLLRRLNEVQHRVTAAVFSRLNGSKERYPDDVLIGIIAGGDDGLGRRLRFSFRRALRMALGSEMSESLPE